MQVQLVLSHLHPLGFLRLKDMYMGLEIFQVFTISMACIHKGTTKI